MLTPIVPWTDVHPLDFINAASQGARLGLERAGLETEANKAANQLQLGYANIAGENARAGLASNTAAAAHALEQAKLNFAIDQAGKVLAQKQNAVDMLNLYRLGTLGVKNRHEDNTEYGNKLRRYMHVGNQVVDLSGDQPVSVFAGPAQIDPYERMDYQAAVRRFQNAQINLNKAGKEATDEDRKEFQDAKNALDQLRSRRSKATDALDNSDQLPQPVQSENDPLGIMGDIPK